MNLIQRPFLKVVGKEENVGYQHFSPFPTMFHTLLQTNLRFSVTYFVKCKCFKSGHHQNLTSNDVESNK